MLKSKIFPFLVSSVMILSPAHLTAADATTSAAEGSGSSTEKLADPKKSKTKTDGDSKTSSGSTPKKSSPKTAPKSTKSPASTKGSGTGLGGKVASKSGDDDNFFLDLIKMIPDIVKSVMSIVNLFSDNGGGLSGFSAPSPGVGKPSTGAGSTPKSGGTPSSGPKGL